MDCSAHSPIRRANERVTSANSFVQLCTDSKVNYIPHTQQLLLLHHKVIGTHKHTCTHKTYCVQNCEAQHSIPKFSMTKQNLFYSVSQKKNIPDIFSYNSKKHCRIFIIFGTRITEKIGNQ